MKQMTNVDLSDLERVYCDFCFAMILDVFNALPKPQSLLRLFLCTMASAMATLVEVSKLTAAAHLPSL
jgi:hypothetical protein